MLHPPTEASDVESQLQSLSLEFFSTLEDIKVQVGDQINESMETYNNPYRSSISAYGVKRDVDIVRLKVKALEDEIRYVEGMIENV